MDTKNMQFLHQVNLNWPTITLSSWLLPNFLERTPFVCCVQSGVKLLISRAVIINFRCLALISRNFLSKVIRQLDKMIHSPELDVENCGLLRD